jgi:hypothetical protein
MARKQRSNGKGFSTFIILLYLCSGLSIYNGQPRGAGQVLSSTLSGSCLGHGFSFLTKAQLKESWHFTGLLGLPLLGFSAEKIQCFQLMPFSL